LAGNHGVDAVQTAVVSIGDELMLLQVYQGQPLAVVELNVGELVKPGEGLRIHQGMIAERHQE